MPETPVFVNQVIVTLSRMSSRVMPSEASVGGALGCLIALPANGMTSAAGGTNFSEVAFAFRISGTSLVVGMGLAVLMGVAGGVLPAFRAARMPITSALRDA